MIGNEAGLSLNLGFFGGAILEAGPRVFTVEALQMGNLGRQLIKDGFHNVYSIDPVQRRASMSIFTQEMSCQLTIWEAEDPAARSRQKAAPLLLPLL